MKSKKISVTRKQYNTIKKVYRFGGFFLILGLLIFYSFCIGKPIEFALIFTPYFITKGWYERQWHAYSLKQCFMLSVGLLALLTTMTLNKHFSIVFSFAVGLLAAYISCKAGVVQLKLKDYKYIEPRYNQLVEFYNNHQIKPFNTDTCSEEELIKRCKDLHFNEENTQLAVEFFINKTKHRILADKLSIDEKSITTRKKRMKSKLNSN